MLALLLDAVVLVALVMTLQQSDSPGYIKALLISLGISVVTFIAALALAPILGTLVLVVIFPLVGIVAGLALWLGFDVEPKKAALGGGIFLVYKIVLSVLFALMFSTPSS
jgi:hypothetical protein